MENEFNDVLEDYAIIISLKISIYNGALLYD